jgi:hypothetical protein
MIDYRKRQKEKEEKRNVLYTSLTKLRANVVQITSIYSRLSLSLLLWSFLYSPFQSRSINVNRDEDHDSHRHLVSDCSYSSAVSILLSR